MTAPASAPRYVVVSPVRDEEAFLEDTIRSMREQTVLPQAWVLVDDGSSDRTGEIADRHAAEVPWIHVVHRDDRGFRAAGAGVIDAFYAGLEALEAGGRGASDWELLVKLDGDLSLDPDYFERCLARFRRDPGLGIGGGVIYSRAGGELRKERHPAFHVRGATKIYRRTCWEAIGGLLHVPGWDTLDEVKANQLGWRTATFDDIRLVQLRFTGDGGGQWSTWVKNGRAAYICGYHPLFVLSRAVWRLFGRPYLSATLGLLWGFASARFSGVRRVEDGALVAYLRDQQLRRLLGRSTIWR